MIVNLYSPSAGCVQCKATERALDKAGIEYNSHIADDDPLLAEVIRERAAHLEGNSFPFVQVFDDGNKLVKEWQGNRPDMIEWLKSQVQS